MYSPRRWEVTPEAGFCFSCYAPAVPDRVAIFIDVVVRLAHGVGKNRPHNELWDVADERVELTATWFAGYLRPEIPPNR